MAGNDAAYFAAAGHDFIAIAQLGTVEAGRIEDYIALSITGLHVQRHWICAAAEHFVRLGGRAVHRRDSL